MSLPSSLAAEKSALWRTAALTAREKAGTDPHRYLLQAGGGDFAKEVALQMGCQQKIKDKLPLWHACPSLYYPGTRACEQASSEITALHKACWAAQFRPQRLCDLTGGLGVDSSYFAREAAAQVLYAEAREDLAEVAAYNFGELGLQNIEVRHAAVEALLPHLPPADFLYLDPSRRDTSERRLYDIEAYSPHLPSLLPALLGRAPRILVKLSPMVDLSRTLQQLGPDHCEGIHVVSVQNDCKEVLFLLSATAVPGRSVPVGCFNYTKQGRESFSFLLEEEARATAAWVDPSLFFADASAADALSAEALSAEAAAAGDAAAHGDAATQCFLWEPNSAVLKAGAFKTVAVRCGLRKLHPHTHLYWGPASACVFPGKRFEVLQVYPYHKASLKTLKKAKLQANVATRNFPLSPEEVRKQLGVKDGGNLFLFAATLRGPAQEGARVLILCQRRP